MTGRYQLLPNLNADDYNRLTESIREHGVEIPVVVDEHGEVLDGHHRVMIADSLGMNYPTIVKSGLSEPDKRILAAELNLARRQLTDAQKVRLGGLLEPDIAYRAEKRRLANLKQGTRSPSATSVALGDEVKRAVDETARTVGIGSGRTYERQKAVIAQLTDEDDGDQLIQHIDDGDWTMEDARKELRTRAKQRRTPDPAPTKPSAPVSLFAGRKGEAAPTPVVRIGMHPDTAAMAIMALRELPTADADEVGEAIVDLERDAEGMVASLPAVIAMLERITARAEHHLASRQRTAS